MGVTVNGYKVSVNKIKRFMELGGGDGCLTWWIYLILPNCMFKNS